MKTTNLDDVLTKYITRETHKGSVNRVRILAKLDLEQLIREQRAEEARLMLKPLREGKGLRIHVAERIKALTDSHKEN